LVVFVKKILFYSERRKQEKLKEWNINSGDADSITKHLNQITKTR